MNDGKLRVLVQTALMMALTCVATMVVQIPSPANGYVNLGDCFVLLGGWILGPWYGFAAGGLGSGLADLMLGYAHYTPGTLVIKGLEALLASILFAALTKRGRHRLFGSAVSAVAGGAVMTLGYFGYAALILGKGLGAALSIPGNLAQALVGAVAAVLLSELLHRAGVWDKLR